MSTYFKNIQFIYQIILNLLEEKNFKLESQYFHKILRQGVPKEILNMGCFEWATYEKEKVEKEIQGRYPKIVNRSLSIPKYDNKKINSLFCYCNQLMDLMNLAKKTAINLRKWSYLYYKDPENESMISDDLYDYNDRMYSNLRIRIVVLYVEIITMYTNLCVNKVDVFKTQTLKQIMKIKGNYLLNIDLQKNNYLDREELIEEFKEHLLQIKNFTGYRLDFDYKWNL